MMLLVTSHSFAQINKIALQASGLTCSMCSNAINKALRTVEFVDKITANIKNSSFEIICKPNVQVDFDVLKKKVEGAGFFIAKLEVDWLFDQVAIAKDAHIESNGIMLHFINANDRMLHGSNNIRIVDKGFLSAKEYKRNEKYTSMECYHTGYIGNCCKKNSQASGRRIYHEII